MRKGTKKPLAGSQPLQLTTEERVAARLKEVMEQQGDRKSVV